MGHSVREEARYSDILEAQLRRVHPELPIEVVNVAIEGHETVQEEKMLRRFWPIVRPDLVVLGFSINDPNLHYRYQQPHPIPVPGPLEVPLHQLLSFRLLDRMYDPAYRWFTDTPAPWDELWQAYDPRSRDWQLFQRAVAGIGTFVRERTHRAPIAICLYEVNALEQRSVYRPVVDTFERNGFIWDEIPRGKFHPVSRFEPHSDEQTHVEYAQALFSEIARSHVLDHHDAAIGAIGAGERVSHP
jgi:hypothetical protein